MHTAKTGDPCPTPECDGHLTVTPYTDIDTLGGLTGRVVKHHVVCDTCPYVVNPTIGPAPDMVFTEIIGPLGDGGGIGS